MLFFPEQRADSAPRPPGLDLLRLAKLGHDLRAEYDDLLDEPVPARMAALLAQLDQGERKLLVYLRPDA